MESIINLRQFDLSSIEKGNVLIVGKRRTGKTTLMCKLCANKSSIYDASIDSEEDYKNLEFVIENNKCATFDDSHIYIRELIQNRSFIELITNATKNEMLNVIVSQSLSFISPTIRKKMDYVIICNGISINQHDQNLFYNTYAAEQAEQAEQENQENVDEANNISFETFSNLLKTNDYIVIDTYANIYSINSVVSVKF